MSGISLEQLRIVVDMPQKMAQEVRSDPRAELLVDAARITPEKITLFPLADPVTNTFKVRLDLPPGQFDLYPGMFVKVAFLIGDTDRLLIPQRAVVQRSEVTAVYIVNGEDVRLRQVRMGQQFGDRVEILAGLQEGETFAMNPVAAGIFIKTGNPEQHP